MGQSAGGKYIEDECVSHRLMGQPWAANRQKRQQSNKLSQQSQLGGTRQVEMDSRSAKQSAPTYNITGIDWAGQNEAGREQCIQQATKQGNGTRAETMLGV